MESIFQQNQVVWAKINGYPWWPAYVKGGVKANQFEVVFFGDFSRGILHTSKIRNFDELDVQVNSKNKVLAAALRSAEKIMHGESTILEEWHKVDKAALTANPTPSKPSPKKPTKKSESLEPDRSDCASETFKAKCQELDTKIEGEEHTESKCGISPHNNLTSSTYNHFMDKTDQCDEPALIEERLEEFASNLRSNEYRTENGVRTIHEVTDRATSLEPKQLFCSNIGVMLSNCVTVCKAKLPQRQYRLTLELLSDSLAKICDFLIRDGFLMEQQVRCDYIDLSKRNSMVAEMCPDLPSPGLFDPEMSPLKAKAKKLDLAAEHTQDSETALEIEERVAFRVKRKLAKLLYSEEHKERLKKKQCELLATQIEQSVRDRVRSLGEYKEEVLALVKLLGKSGARTLDFVCGFASGKKVDAMLNELNKLTSC